MAASSRIMIAAPSAGFQRAAGSPCRQAGSVSSSTITARLDANCGAGNWAATPSGLHGVVNDALAIYFLDTALANAFVARWCIGCRAESNEDSFRLRDDAPATRLPAPRHKTP